MEARNDWFTIMLSGLPTNEQKHVLQTITEDDARHMLHIRETNAREAERIDIRNRGRDLTTAASGVATGDS